MKIKYIIIALTILIGTINSQTDFHYRYGTNYYDRARSVVQTNDSNFVVCGTTDGFGSAGDIFLLKVNAVGQIMWCKDYSGINNDEAFDILELPNGHLVFCGSTYSFGEGSFDSFVTEVDATGNIIWSKTYGDISAELFFKISRDEGAGFYVAGYASIFPTQSSSLIHLDSLGNVKWAVYAPVWDPEGDWEPSTCIALKSGGAALCCGFNGGLSVSCYRFSSVGLLMWSHNFSDANSGACSGMQGVSVIENKKKEILINVDYAGPNTVASSVDNFVLNVDSSGNPKWFKSYGGIFEDYARKIVGTKDDGFILCGYTNSIGNGDYDACIIKAKNDGSLDWAKTYGTVWAEKSSMAKQTSGKGYILCGQSWSSGTQTDSSKIHLIRTDSLGKTACNYVSWTPTVNTQTIVSAAAPAPQTYTFYLTDFLWTVTNHNFSNRNICSLSEIEALNALNQNIIIYPNPNNGDFKIQINALNNSTEINNGELVLFNSFGQKVHTQKINLGLNDIRTNGLQTGMYYFSISEDKIKFRNGKIAIE